MKKQNIGFIGGGRITRIIIQAFRNKSIGFESIRVFEPDDKISSELVTSYPEIEVVASNLDAAGQDIVFLAVHPPVIISTAEEVKRALNSNSVIISLAPKITIDKLSASVGSERIVRLIPNATSYINKGYNPVTFHPSFTDEEKRSILKLLKKLGKTIEVKEEQLEAYAIFSAMLPTYFWFQWNELEKIAEKAGLNEAESKQIIRSTLVRAIKLYYNSGLTPEEVMDLIPVKPIGENEEEIKAILDTKLSTLYTKIKP